MLRFESLEVRQLLTAFTYETRIIDLHHALSEQSGVEMQYVDVTGDESQEMIIRTTSEIVVLSHESADAWREDFRLDVSEVLQWFALKDLTGNDRPDMLLQSETQFMVFENVGTNDGRAAFHDEPFTEVAGQYTEVELIDVNEDNQLDLMLAKPDGLDVLVRAADRFVITQQLEWNHPHIITTGDVDNDGDVDLVAVSQESTSPYRVFELVDQQFTTHEFGHAIRADGCFPRRATFADINPARGNGQPDLVVERLCFDGTGIPTTTFVDGHLLLTERAQWREAGARIFGAIGDLDGDGDDDFARSSGEDTIHGFVNSGGLFLHLDGHHQLNEHEWFRARTPWIDDIDRDGQEEVFGLSSDRIVVTEIAEPGLFDPNVDFYVGSQPIFHDFDDDGFMDYASIELSRTLTEAMVVRWGAEGATFGESTIVELGKMQFGDKLSSVFLNDDFAIDLIFGERVMLNQGNRQFQLSEEPLESYLENPKPVESDPGHWISQQSAVPFSEIFLDPKVPRFTVDQAVPARLNDDDHIDLVGYKGTRTYTYLNEGDGKYKRIKRFDSGRNGIVADYNGDGLDDLIRYESPHRNTVFIGKGDGDFENGVTVLDLLDTNPDAYWDSRYPTAAEPSYPVARQHAVRADFDGDGLVDLAVGFDSWANGRLGVHRGLPDGGFDIVERRYNLEVGFLSFDNTDVQLFDLNNDGLPELIYEYWNGFAVLTAVEPVVPGDVDRDGNVTFEDFLVIANHFGSTNATREDGDLDGDKVVSFLDFLAFANAFAATATN